MRLTAAPVSSTRSAEAPGAGARAAMLAMVVAGAGAACAGARPEPASDPAGDPRAFQPPAPRAPGAVQSRTVKRILPREPRGTLEEGAAASGEEPLGTALGTFRNTYYNFPKERDYRGPPVALFDSRCQPLAQVPLPFHDTLCVQGSGSLDDGVTVSFARRNCSCARTCPRTGQQICFDALDRGAFPWGRGAAGTAIVPLRSVAVDVSVIPLHTPLFIPDYVGLPRDREGSATHDGCFVAEDRGIKVLGQHVDIFTGDVSMTRVWDDRVPTNRGVAVFVDSPRCAALD